MVEKRRDGFEKGMELESASLSSQPAGEGGEVMSHLGKRLSLPWLFEKDKVAKYQNRSHRQHWSEKSFFHIFSLLGRKKTET